MDETVTSCLRPLLEGLTFTIAGHPEHLPHCASAYEGDLIKEFGSEIGLGGANTKQKRDSSGIEATRRLNNKRNNRSRGRGRGWSMNIAAPSCFTGDRVGYSIYCEAPGLTTAKSMTIISGPRLSVMSAITSWTTPSASGAILPMVFSMVTTLFGNILRRRKPKQSRLSLWRCVKIARLVGQCAACSGSILGQTFLLHEHRVGTRERSLLWP